METCSCIINTQPLQSNGDCARISLLYHALTPSLDALRTSLWEKNHCIRRNVTSLLALVLYKIATSPAHTLISTVTIICVRIRIHNFGWTQYDIWITRCEEILEVNLETPQENSMLIPHSLLRGELLDLKLCIKKLNQE